MTIHDFAFYRIQNVLGRGDAKDATSGYIHVPGARMVESEISVYDFNQRGVEFTDHFEFLFIEVAGAEGAGSRADTSGRTFYVVNRRSGLCLIVDSMDNGAPLKQAQWLDKPHMTEMMAQFHVTEEKGQYRIRSEYNGGYLAVDPGEKKATENFVPIKVFNELETTDGAANDLAQMSFILEKVDEAVAGEKLEARDELAVSRRVPRIRAMTSRLPATTEPQLVGFDELPFFMVRDPVFPPPRQIEMSPFYTLRLYRLWQKMSDREFDGLAERESTEMTRLGLRQADVAGFTEVLGLRTRVESEVTASASASFSGFGAKVATSVTARVQAEVERTSQRTTEREQTRETTEEQHTTDRILYPKLGRAYRVAKWRAIDRYELCRADGVPIKVLDSVSETDEVIDAFVSPRAEGAAKPKAARPAARKAVKSG